MRGKPVDYTDVRIGKLVGIEPVTKRRWKMRCDCGAVVERDPYAVAYNAKKRVKTPSCGCETHKEITPDDVEGVLINHLWVGKRGDITRKKRRARQRQNERVKYTDKKTVSKTLDPDSHEELSWNLTLEEFTKLVTSPCQYCGGNDYIERKIYAGKFRNPKNLPIAAHLCGIDRRDPSIGYEPDNCDPCCKMCNYAKNAYTQDEFCEWIARVVAHNLDMDWVMRMYNTNEAFREKMKARMRKG